MLKQKLITKKEGKNNCKNSLNHSPFQNLKSYNLHSQNNKTTKTQISNSKLNLACLPQHIAIIMDGNRRWARQHGLKIFLGHKKMIDDGINSVVNHALKRHIRYLTLWAFSTENWNREKKEVDYLMNLFRKLFNKKIAYFHRHNIKINVIGRITDFAPDIQEKITHWLNKTKNNTALTLTFALSYGGRDEILRSTQKIFSHWLKKIKSKSGSEILTQLKQKINQLTFDDLQKCFDTRGLPDPDIIIRTGGEHRLSGFLPYQSAYSELFFPKIFMPDFKNKDFDQILLDFQNRSRRFGK